MAIHGGVVADDSHSDSQVSSGDLGRKEAIAKSWLEVQKSDTKAHQAYKMAKDIEVPKGNRNLDG